MRRSGVEAGILTLTLGMAMASETMESKRSLQDTNADTNPNSSFWRGVPAVFADRDTSGKPLPTYRTEIRSRWTDRNLYFLFICPYEQLHLKPNPNTKAETNDLWNWDVAEAFIGSDFENIRRYREFEISPQAEWVDLDIDLDTPHPVDGWLWNSGMEASARIDAPQRIWYGFMRIPYAAVDLRPALAENRLRINLYRSQGAGVDHKLINWQPTGRPAFHVPQAFGELKLVQ
jgi:hypothetical protein